MSARGRVFLLLVPLAAAAATAAWGQTVAPALGPAGSAPQGAESIPDFSGIWAHPYLTGFEPPASGPGPVTNRSRRNGVGNFQRLVGGFTKPILNTSAADAAQTQGAISQARRGSATLTKPRPTRGAPTVI